MSYYNVKQWTTAIADAIRAKEESSDPIFHQDFPDRISNLQTGYTVGDVIRGDLGSNLVLDGVINRVSPEMFIGNLEIVSVDGEDVYELAESVFDGCSSLETIDFPNLKYIGEYAFNNTSSLTEAEFPSAENIRSRAFYNSGLERIVIGSEGVSTTLYNLVLGECRNLTTCEIYETSAIPNEFFLNCENLETLIIRNAYDVPSLASSALNGCLKLGSYQGGIYVDDNLVNSYKNATNWSLYGPIIFPISDLGGA